MLVTLGGGIAAVLLFALPGQVRRLSAHEAGELVAARSGATVVSPTLVTLWAELGSQGSLSLSRERVDADLTTAQKAEKATDEALAHVQTARSDLVQIAGIPLQFRQPATIPRDRATLGHLEKALQEARRLAHAAALQLGVAQHLLADRSLISNQLMPSLGAKNWTQAAKTATDLQTDLATQQEAIANLENLLDPLWGKWFDAMVSYSYTAQQFALASATGQNRTAAELGSRLGALAAQIDATASAARDGAAAWNTKTVQPGLAGVAWELAAAGSS